MIRQEDKGHRKKKFILKKWEVWGRNCNFYIFISLFLLSNFQLKKIRMLEILSHSSHFLPFLSPKRRREIGKTQPSFFDFSPHFQINPPIEADFRKYLLSLMCKRSKESDMGNLMRKLPIGIQTFEDIRRKNILL